ncbi:type I-C CRISPR-associated endonuclease Cas1c [soil metagenome]
MTTQLLNTLFVQTQGAYLRLENDTVRVEIDGEKRLKVPLHHLGGFALFGNVLISPYLISQCALDGRDVVWYSRTGRFRARLNGPTSGNVLLRCAQHAAQVDSAATLELARQFVLGKVRTTRGVLQRALRDGDDDADIAAAIEAQRTAIVQLQGADTIETVRGAEGQAAVYFSVFDRLIRVPDFAFSGRNRRPPRDPVNALLSFLYTLLRQDCAAALEGVGLDPQVGYLHVLRPGRPALALDLMEEFRSWWADRLALTLINRRQISAKDFENRPGGAVHLSEDGRKEVITSYQKRKQETIRHRLFKEPVPVGLLPLIQARLLARHLRGDLDHYPTFRAR